MDAVTKLAPPSWATCAASLLTKLEPVAGQIAAIKIEQATRIQIRL